jgi:anti-sigma28 factor (negative regulator of flagellin synthesis)
MMISQLASVGVANAYTNVASDAQGSKTIQPNATVTSKEDGTTKVQQLQNSINAGEYKVDLSKLAGVIADSLL